MSHEDSGIDDRIVRKIVLFLVCVTVVVAGPFAATSDAASDKPVWLVITKPEFQEAIKPLADKRQADGLRAIISTEPIAKAIAAVKNRPAFILLVGDDQVGQEEQSWYLPGPRRKLYRWRAVQAMEFAADPLLGDFDGDLLPDVPVGRIPVRSVGQLKVVIDKILAYENEQPDVDDLRLPVWAGTPGYGKIIDSMTTGLLLTTIKQNLSSWVEPWIISSDETHPLCGWPPDQWKMYSEQLKRGGFLSVLMGHGSANYFHAMRFNGTYIGYTAAHANQSFSNGKPTQPLIIFACDTGRFAESENCLAESLFFMPAGPIAVIAATTESHPLTNYFTSVPLLKADGENDKTLGDVWFSAQRKALKGRNFLIEKLLCDVEGKLEDTINIAKLRRDQMLMYTLLGDPATKLRLPGKLDVELEYQSDRWHWKANKPNDAARLFISFCPSGQSLPAIKLQIEKEDALKRSQQANATFEFEPLGELAFEKSWSGTISRQGTLRLVAVGDGCIYASAIQLDSDNMPISNLKPVKD